MPRSAARFKRVGDWVFQNEETIEDPQGNPYHVITETVDTLEVETGNVVSQGRWRVRIKSKHQKKPRARSYSGELREELAAMRVAEIINVVASRHEPRVLQRSLTYKNKFTKMDIR